MKTKSFKNLELNKVTVTKLNIKNIKGGCNTDGRTFITIFCGNGETQGAFVCIIP